MVMKEESPHQGGKNIKVNRIRIALVAKTSLGETVTTELRTRKKYQFAKLTNLLLF